MREAALAPALFLRLSADVLRRVSDTDDISGGDDNDDDNGSGAAVWPAVAEPWPLPPPPLDVANPACHTTVRALKARPSALHGLRLATPRPPPPRPAPCC